MEAEEIEFEVIIIDNRTSEKKALEFLEKLSQRDYIKVVRYNRSFNYAEMINIGATLARYPTVVTINNDLEFSAIKTFGPLIRHILDPTIGVVAPVLTNRDGSIQSSGIRLGYKGVAGHVSQPIGQCAQVSAVSFAVAMFRKKDFFDLAGLDQRFKVGLNDVDFCLRIQQKGLRIAICAESSVFHAGSASRGSSFQIKRIFRASIEVLRFMKLYPKLEDPFLRQVS